MSRMLDDVELRLFTRELQHTPSGRRYLKAWNAIGVAGKNLARLDNTVGIVEGSEDERRSLQRAYIEACENASLALDVLNQLYGWPDVSPARSFTFRPSRFQRRARTAP